MLSQLKSPLLALLGRQLAYRIGRALYLGARGDIPNDMTRNGETLVQRCVLQALAQSGPSASSLVAFDVGANIGDWSLSLIELARQAGRQDHLILHAFEPVPSTHRTLRGRLPQGAAWLHLHEQAMSASSGTANIYVAADNAGTNSLHSGGSEGDRQATTIRLTSGAEFCVAEGVQHVHLFKCDTEGHDMEVIRGARPLLVEGRVSVLQFEYNHRWIFSRNSLHDVFLAVSGLPYSVCKLQGEEVLEFDRWHPELDKFFEGNYLLVHRDARAWLPIRTAAFDRYNTLTTH
ncbi:FkbM family methyltransferase [Ideonella sp. DXS22W]|uniref:FkbM family methyltransferase n=1 Tax=Pseudaquabacterium inlustre TaxID=2984192 RepID=A0ABU9CDD4_9BURK